jgi:ABC-type sugar transport system substrate-binding protein
LIKEAASRAETSIRVLAIEGDAGDESAAARVRGLTRYLKYLPNVDSFEIIAGQWDREKAYLGFKCNSNRPWPLLPKIISNNWHHFCL